jgi:polar amino acid transport system substrate-binding protein
MVFLLLGLAMIALTVALFFQDFSLARLRKAGTIRIGYAIEAPYAFLQGGEVTGESPEVARQMVARLGIGHSEWRQVEFGALISELEAGRVDVIAAGMFITPGRAQRVGFSTPTFRVRQGLLVLKGNPRQLHSYAEAVARADVKIAALTGAVEEALLRRLGLPESRLVLVPDALTGRVAVESGVADALALSSPTVQWMALQAQLGRTEMAQPFAQPELAASGPLGVGAFAFRREDRQLRAAWNAALKDYIGSAEHRALVARFGFTPAELPEASPRGGAPAR